MKDKIQKLSENNIRYLSDLRERPFLRHKMHKPWGKTLEYYIKGKLTKRNCKENKEITHKLGDIHLYNMLQMCLETKETKTNSYYMDQ